MKKFLFLFLLCGAAQAAIFKAMDNFDAGYSINVGWVNLHAANAVLTWRNFGDRYEIVNEMHVVGAAAILKKNQSIQKSMGRITPKGLVPEMFTTVRNGKLVEKVIFDWDNLMAHIEVDGNKREFKMTADAQDILTLAYQLGHWQANEKSWPRKVSVITGKRANEYDITLLADETVKTELGPFETHHFHCEITEGRYIELWIMKNTHQVVSIYFYDPSDTNIHYSLRTLPVSVPAAPQSPSLSPQASPEINNPTPAEPEH